MSYGNHLTLAFLLLVLAMFKCLPSSVTFSIPSLLCEPSNIAFLTHTCPKFISLKFLRFWTGDSGLYRPGDSGLEESPPLRAEYPAYPRRLRPLTPETPALCVLESIKGGSGGRRPSSFFSPPPTLISSQRRPSLRIFTGGASTPPDLQHRLHFFIHGLGIVSPRRGHHHGRRRFNFSPNSL